MPLSEGFGQLQSLTSLNLSSDVWPGMYLKSLPESKSHLIPFTCLLINPLTFVRTNYCSVLLPEGFGQLQNLQDLNLYYCSSLESLPESKLLNTPLTHLCRALIQSIGLTVAPCVKALGSWTS